MNGPVPGLETKSSGLAILLSFFWPGLGHLYLGRVIRGVLTMILTIVINVVGTLAFFASLAQERLDIALGCALIPFAWWMWGMVSSRRLCDRHNLMVFERAQDMRRNDGWPRESGVEAARDALASWGVKSKPGKGRGDK